MLGLALPSAACAAALWVAAMCATCSLAFTMSCLEYSLHPDRRKARCCGIGFVCCLWHHWHSCACAVGLSSSPYLLVRMHCGKGVVIPKALPACQDQACHKWCSTVQYPNVHTLVCTVVDWLLAAGTSCHTASSNLYMLYASILRIVPTFSRVSFCAGGSPCILQAALGAHQCQACGCTCQESGRRCS